MMFSMHPASPMTRVLTPDSSADWHLRAATGGGEFAKLHRESAAEAAAFLALAHFADFPSGLLQEFSRSGFDSEFAQSGAAVVVGCLARVFGRFGGEADFNKELAQLAAFVSEGLHFRLVGVVAEHFAEMIAENAAAGAGRDDDAVAFGKLARAFAGDGLGLRAEAAVEGDLSAAGLRGGADGVGSGGAQQAQGGDADFGAH